MPTTDWPPTPARTASYMETDRWLIARGWERQGGTWRSVHRDVVTIANYETALKIQRRRDGASTGRPR